MGPKEALSTAPTPGREAAVVASRRHTFRRHTLPPLDDRLYALQAGIPGSTRSGLHRCLQRHGISRLPGGEGDGTGEKRFEAYPIGCFHIDTAEARTERGKLHPLVAVDRTSKFAFARSHGKVTRTVAAGFLGALVEAAPYKVYTVPIDNGVQFAHTLADVAPSDGGNGAPAEASWTALQGARTGQVHAFGDAHEDHARRLKAPRGLTQDEFIHRPWTKNLNDSRATRHTTPRD